MEIFKKCITEQVFVFSVSNDGRNCIQARKFTGAQTSFAHNQLITSLGLFLKEPLKRL